MTETERVVKEIAVNRRARRNYEILETLEAGLALSGTEVKTLRAGRISLEEAYVKQIEGELWLVGAHIAEYLEGNIFNHEPTRARRLLVHRKELRKWSQKTKEKGLTMIPLKLYFHGKWAKLLIALARGRRTHDKRQELRKKESQKVLRGLRRR
ncbi:MAG: SsrA-binding protein SmpB [Planctomycetes bacterium]|nr:SsrA-binding protein SmpB [Planctomycetota bacterium]MBL7007563.1 SsrA-binding protein SmpB [Planctomycetota bacterium]